MRIHSFYLENLGCSKNEVDGNNIVSRLLDRGLFSESNPERADLIILNTCGFIQHAVEESIDRILDLSQYKKNKFYVVGCMVQRYQARLVEELPEVDLFLGTGEMKNIENYVFQPPKAKVITGNVNEQLFDIDRIKRAHEYDTSYSYVKIAEGCDNHCTYCIIPKLRGKYRSYSIREIVREAKIVAKEGIRELILVSQDTSRYGHDIASNLIELCQELEKIEGIEWIRLQYFYPDCLTDEFIEYLSRSKKLVPYLDMPIQHASNAVLKLMNRNISKEEIIRRIEKLRNVVSDVCIRTTLIVGFPGETEQEFEELKDFVRKMKFDRLGVFTYSDEEDAPSYKMQGKNAQEIMDERKEEILAIQEEIASELSQQMIGKTLPVIIDEVVENQSYARTKYDSPDVDGLVIIEGKYPIGEIIEVTITDGEGYVFYAKKYESSK